MAHIHNCIIISATDSNITSIITAKNPNYPYMIKATEGDIIEYCVLINHPLNLWEKLRCLFTGKVI